MAQSVSHDRLPARTARPGRSVAAWLAVGVAALLLVVAGVSGRVAQALGHDVTRTLGGPELAIQPEHGHAYVCDLSSLGIGHLADTNDHPARSALVLCENGRPLQPHSLHDDIRGGQGLFSHWGPTLYFAATDGSNPLTNGWTYTITYHVVNSSVVEFATSQSFCLAVLLLLGLTSAGIIAQGSGFSAQLDSRAAAVVLGVALAISLFLQVAEGRHRFGVSPDSDSYTEQLNLSSRPPLYHLLMTLVSDPAAIRKEIATLAQGGNSNRIMDGASDDPVVKVVLAQKILVATAFVGVFAALATCVPVPLAAALVLLVAQMASKPQGNPVTTWLAVLLLLAPLLSGFCRAGFSWCRRLLVCALGAVVLRPVLALALGSTLVSPQLDMLLSESLAMAIHAGWLAAVLLCVWQRRARWLYAAALLAGAAYLVRPASIFLLGTVVLLVAAAWLGRWGFKPVQLAGSLACALVVCAAPALIKRIGHARNQDVSMMKWAMAAFSLGVAEPADVARIQDPEVRRLLDEALQAKAKYRAEVVIPVNGAYDEEIIHLGYYTYRIMLPLSQKISAEKFSEGSPEQLRERHRLLGGVADAIYRVHPGRLLHLYFSSYHFMAGRGTRLSQGQPFWLTAIVAFVLAAWVRNRLAVAGALFGATHLLHLLVISLFDQPLDRYVYATEFIAVVGICLIATGAVVWASARPDASGASAA